MNRRALAIGAATLTFASAIGLSATSGWLISEAALMPQILTLQVAIVSVRAFGIARGSFRWVDRVVSHEAALHETVARRSALWSTLAALGPRGAWRLRRGDAVTRIMQDAETVQDGLLRVAIPATAAFITAAGAITVQALLNVTAALAFLAAFIIAGVLVPALTYRIERRAAQAALAVRARLNAVVAELTAHADELRVLGIDDECILEMRAIDNERLRVEQRAALLTGATQLLALIASGLAIAAALMAGIPALFAGTLQGPHLAVVVLLPWAASEIISALAIASTAQVRVRAARERIAEVTDKHVVVPDLVITDVPQLRVHDVTVRWDREAAIDAVSLSVGIGERVALVGPSGAGKSTVLSAVLGLVEYEGVISAGPQVRGNRADAITALMQTTHVFHTTLRENLRLADPFADDDKLRDALRRAGLGSDVGLDEDLTARSLSGGERQRLGIARLLLTECPYIVLDEPTEHLDEETARAVFATIVAESRDRGLLMTTHLVEDLRDFDRIHVIEHGRITQSGTFAECCSGNGWFAEAVAWRMDKSGTGEVQ